MNKKDKDKNKKEGDRQQKMRIKEGKKKKTGDDNSLEIYPKFQTKYLKNLLIFSRKINSKMTDFFKKQAIISTVSLKTNYSQIETSQQQWPVVVRLPNISG